MERKELTEKEIEAKAIKDAMANFYANKGKTSGDPTATNPVQGVEGVLPMGANPQVQQPQHLATPANVPPATKFNPNDFQQGMQQETDPDLMVGFDIIPLPSKGMFYASKISEVKVEYLTAKDEDLLTTPALLEKGTVLDTLLKRKIKTPIDIDTMLTGDKNAILLFLRASSYGHKYQVNATNPFTGTVFKTEIDLRKLKYKEPEIMPDEAGEFKVELPMRKKSAKFRILTHHENKVVTKNAESIQETYNAPFAETGTLRIKAALTQIGDRREPDYINRFVDAMPAGDALAVRRKMKDVEPDVDMNYEFTTPDGKLFSQPIVMGIDFFFPSL